MTLTERFAAARRRRSWLAYNHVLLHQMGKVGSTSLRDALSTAGRARHRTHRLNPESFRRLPHHRRNYVSPAYKQGEVNRVVMHDLRAMNGADGPTPWSLLFKASRKRFKVLTMVRDPIARSVSAFFETLPDRTGIYTREQAETVDVDELLGTYFREMEFDFVDTWFDLEFRGVFGIDVVKTPFDPERGYALVSDCRHDAMLVRLESLDNARPAIARLAEVPSLEFVRARGGETNIFNNVRKRFVKALTFPKGYLDAVYRGKIVQHCYTAEEIARFRERWDR